MMAFERLEPFGSLHLESVIGQVCAVTANVHRGPKSDVSRPSDFMPNLARFLGEGAEAEPILLDDPEAQSALIMEQVFGRARG